MGSSVAQIINTFSYRNSIAVFNLNLKTFSLSFMTLTFWRIWSFLLIEYYFVFAPCFINIKLILCIPSWNTLYPAVYHVFSWDTVFCQGITVLHLEAKSLLVHHSWILIIPMKTSPDFCINSIFFLTTNNLCETFWENGLCLSKIFHKLSIYWLFLSYFNYNCLRMQLEICF